MNQTKCFLLADFHMAIPVQIISQMVITIKNPIGIPSCDVIVEK
jgi:hypothetical protein